MNNTFSYAILQYKHSLLLREAVNVGILFAFPSEKHLEFVYGNHQRAKLIYPDFDQTSFTRILAYIEKALVESRNELFTQGNLWDNLKSFINHKLLREDSTALQFTDIAKAISISDVRNTVRAYSELLIPGIDTKKVEEVRHNENFIIKSYTKYLFESDSQYNKKIFRNTTISDNDVTLRADISWRYGKLHLVKALSFDLKEEQDIQQKAATNFGYLSLLSEKARRDGCKFDFLVAKPQEKRLVKHYEYAIKNLSKAPVDIEIIDEKGLRDYSAQTISMLSKIEIL